MEEAFNKLKDERKNDVDSLVKWMKEANVIDGKKVTEEKARELFNDVSNKQDVDLASFKGVLEKLAAEQNSNFEDYAKALAAKGQGIVTALSAAAGALQAAFK